MFTVRRPDRDMLARWLAEQEAAPLVRGPLDGHTVDHHRVVLGRGRDVFRRAAAALRRWEMFHLGWVDLVPPSAPQRVGTTVAVVVRHLGFWSLNPSRIVECIDEPERAGFVYRTLPDHAVDGEEQFLVAREPDDRVVYDLMAHSRPRHLLARLGSPVARVIQRRFARDSMRAMRAAVEG